MVIGNDRLNVPAGLQGVFDRSRTSLTMVDPDLADHPLTIVNARFTDVTGYTPEESLGRNCRFLQPPTGCETVRARIRDFLADPAQSEGRFILANQRRDGSGFVNIVYMAKLSRPHGSPLILGSQFEAPGEENLVYLYESALREDLASLNTYMGESGWVFLGSMQAIANSARLLAQYHLDQDMSR